jgi:hydrogenase expression/formation protein HypE
LAATLNEFAHCSGQGLVVELALVPVRPEVAAACEILGIDPLAVANEGKLVAVVEPRVAGAMVEAMRQHPLGRETVVVGEVVANHSGVVAVRNSLGVMQVLEMPLGEQLPRIC